MVCASAQYLGYGFWDLAQRESFFDWFLFPSVALQMLVQARARTMRARSISLGLGAVGALSMIPWLGKPTYALFTLVQIVSLLMDRDIPLPWRARLGRFQLAFEPIRPGDVELAVQRDPHDVVGHVIGGQFEPGHPRAQLTLD